ncbi:capsule biosynthesis protein [Ensifer soli]|uniref:capsule biosynthesis protein n=1 Tax=Ciceribacter sp. sgz301302 TaxID=3342379 RepID=UPI0035B9D14D
MNDAPPRTFLFLQGPSSPIFMKIAARLEARGHRCLRINLNMGDRIFWRRRGAFHYRGRVGDFGAYAARVMREERVSDLVLLGEERPHHRAATAAARALGVDVTVIEMGYLRPDWLTVERDGMSSNSHFPADPDHILEAARALPEPDWTPRYSQTFVADAGYDLLYNLPNVFLWFVYPHYRWHALFHPLAEYYGWVRRLMAGKRRAREAAEAIAALRASRAPYFVLPLQLQTDYQLRAHSPYCRQEDAIDEVLTSFAAHADPDARLLVKLHPLDNGLIDWRGFITRRAAALHLGDRAAFVDGGDLAALLAASRGCVTVNSTVGLHALRERTPVKVLGTAIFDMPGLTDQRPLDAFWRDPALPDADLVSAFFRLVAASIQVRGNFYSTAGTDAGAEAIAERLDRRSVNEPGGFVDPPPRRHPRKRPPASGRVADPLS